MKRTKLTERNLPSYSYGEEIMNMVTHLIGGVLAIGILLYCILSASNTISMVGCVIYGISMIALYCVSSIYHGLHSGTAKKVMQVIDHCMIYYLIVGTYTAVILCAMVPVYPLIGWGLLGIEWSLAIVATVFTAIDLHKYRTISMICYIGMGWAIIFFVQETIFVLTDKGFQWLLWGGIGYTIGAILYGIGSHRKWFHSIFHIFVIIGSLLQAVSILLYCM